MAEATGRLKIVHTEASLGWGGQEIRILTEAKGMIGRGHQVTLLCPAHARLHAEAQRQRIPVVALPIDRKRIRGIAALRRWLKENPVDVINTHSSTDSWLAALATRWWSGAPPIVRTRHISAAVPGNQPTRWLYQSATRHIVTTGERIRRALIDENRFNPETIVSIPTGVDTTHFVPGDRTASRAALDLPPSGFLIGIVATLRSWKGHRYLLQAFARLRDRNARLVIVGDGPQREALQQELIALGIQDRVTMPGDQRNVVPWLQALDIFVLPSYANEGVPQAIVQAMLCGLPVISTRVGSIDEVVRDQETGLLIAPHDSAQIVEAIEMLSADSARRQLMGKRARAVAEREFGIDAMLNEMETLFRATTTSR
ncbi:MAG TPA: glycosyltransferase family 4 protein [Burkholderiales bacterium]|nr:glycosyltransferase family 4 protein [Burkholderiales bacterium]